MKFRKNVVILLIVVLSVLWGVNIFYYNSKSIEGRVFFRHIIETDIGDILMLSYIENKDNKDQIYYVKIPELDNQPIYVRGSGVLGDGSNAAYSDKYYNYCKLYIELGNYYTEYDEKTDKMIPLIKGERTFSKITYGLTNGDEYTEDIGKVYIRDYKEEDNNGFVESAGGGVTSLGNNRFSDIYQDYTVNKETRLTGYGGRFQKEIQSMFDIKVNGKNVEDIKLPIKVNKTFHVEAKAKKNVTKSMADFYSINLDLYFEDAKGKKHIVPFNINSKAYVSDKSDVSKEELENIIKIRRGINEDKLK